MLAESDQSTFVSPMKVKQLANDDAICGNIQENQWGAQLLTQLAMRHSALAPPLSPPTVEHVAA